MPKGKAKKKPKAAGGGLKGVAKAAGSALLGGGKSGGGGSRRSRGPNYWANKVIVEKLKQKYRRLKYGSVR